MEKEVIVQQFRDPSLDLSRGISSIRGELDEHRDAINENTNEIQSNHEFLCDLDEKLNKLNEKVELLLSMLAQKKADSAPETKRFVVAPLTKREKELFITLYTLCEDGKIVTYRLLSEKSGFSESLISSYIASFIAKGIPLSKRYDDGVVVLNLDSNFREAQAKENIVGVNTLLSYWIRKPNI